MCIYDGIVPFQPDVNYKSQNTKKISKMRTFSTKLSLDLTQCSLTFPATDPLTLS